MVPVLKPFRKDRFGKNFPTGHKSFHRKIDDKDFRAQEYLRGEVLIPYNTYEQRNKHRTSGPDATRLKI